MKIGGGSITLTLAAWQWNTVNGNEDVSISWVIPTATTTSPGLFGSQDKIRLNNALLKTDIIDGGTW